MSEYRFTVLVAVYDAAKYVRAMLASLEHQTYGLENIEVIFVDDGSTDGSLALLEDWAGRRSNAKVFHQSNAGPGAARNRALQEATGQWVTSIDADDLVDRDYFSSLHHLLARDTGSKISLIAPRIYLLDDATGRYRDKHPLGHKYRFGDRLARLSEEPEAFVLGTAFLMRLDVLRANKLSYDPGIVPTFEDAHLIGRYLATFEDPVVGISASAHYFYRKRTAGDSLVQSGWGKLERFVVVPEQGYLGLLRAVASPDGRVPRWAQYMVLYDLLWYFKEDRSMKSKVGWLDAAAASQFMNVVDSIMAYIDEESLSRFPCNPHPWSMRQSLLTRYVDAARPEIRAFRWKDRGGRYRATILHSGPAPVLSAFVDGSPVTPETIGTQLHSFFGREFATERAIELPTGGEVSLWADGMLVNPRKMEQVSWSNPPRPSYTLAPHSGASRHTGNYARLAKIRTAVTVAGLTLGDGRFVTGIRFTIAAIARRRKAQIRLARQERATRLRKLATADAVRERYGQSWVIMDRVRNADDNGEHLYRYIAASRPDINAFFLLERASPDWDRLADEGFRLVEYGSDESALLLLNAEVRASSDAVEGCMYPISRRDFGELPGIFVFLQHGVLKDDISRWLNGKQIELMITTTDREYASFVDSTSPYALNCQQVAQTGLARHDRLLESYRKSANEPRSILVMPTWRRSLRDLLQLCNGAAERDAAFRESDFGRAWMDLLIAPEIARIARESGAAVRLLLHPLIDDLVPDLDLPEHVVRLNTGSVRFQEEIARSSMLVTDYTSVAFDAAYLGIPVAYYQFDADAMFSGDHTLRKGYFDYVADGLGPVHLSHVGMLACIEEHASRGFVPDDLYVDRIARTFRFRDTENRERIVLAIEKRIEEVRI